MSINSEITAIETWPFNIKLLVGALVCVVVLIAGFFLDIAPQLQDLEKLEKKEQQLKTTFESRQKKIVNFSGYKNQYAEVEQMLVSMLKKLPKKSEVADLLVEVSQVGLNSGLKFKLFKPMQGKEKDFYKELPIQIKVVGQYKQLAVFISGLAGLSRIVTIHNIAIQSSKEQFLTMNALLKTYSEPEATNKVLNKRKQ
ncbi:MAG: type 4a pilus biogenesis protein PilO [Methylococcales bacterium]|jgi:type IV pilus assembly protein PilO|nr:pilus assembly protein PilO [Methylococcales bacterium]